MIYIEDYICNFTEKFGSDVIPWLWIADIESLIESKIESLSSEDYFIENNIAIHKTAVVETNVTIKGPAMINKNCFIGSGSYLRGGIYLGNNVKIGTNCEVKKSVIFNDSAIAHFNFIGDSIIWSHVNFEAGSITANHYNERLDKDILVKVNQEIINTKTSKFGALVGDFSKVGANAVLSPGTILKPKSIIKRLELVEQVPEN